MFAVTEFCANDKWRSTVPHHTGLSPKENTAHPSEIHTSNEYQYHYYYLFPQKGKKLLKI